MMSVPCYPRRENTERFTNATHEKSPRVGEGFDSGAEDGIRTRDLLLGKEMLYH